MWYVVLYDVWFEMCGVLSGVMCLLWYVMYDGGCGVCYCVAYGVRCEACSCV